MKVVDLFAGIGGLSLGFQNAGFEIQAAYDNWEDAISVHEKNFDYPIHCIDLGDEEKAAEHVSQYAPDVIIGGPPCQDFSIAGKRKEGERANLTISFAKIVAKIQPQIVVMENVYNIEKSNSLNHAIDILKENQFGITKRVLDASLTGVPQKRKRFFLIGKKDSPDELFGEKLDADLAEKSMTIYDFFGDSLGIEHYYAHPRSYKRRAVFSIHEPSSTIRRVNRPIPSNYVKHPADKVKVTEAVRPLTTEERSQVQTFPKSFKLVGSKSKKEHLIANAVPVNLAEYVARSILKTLES